jgi:phosphoribosylanthranilate isomerase
MSGVRVKICGLSRLEDARVAADLGADALGFVLWPKSPRAIRPAAAAAVGRAVPPFVTRVGVVVDFAPADVAYAVLRGRFDAIQLHGDEPVESYLTLGPRILKAVSLASDEDIAAAIALPGEVTVLVDAADRERRGGTGQRADWVRAAAVARARPLVLAGGLTADTVVEAIERVRPWAVDVSSGVEDAPGIKSAKKMEAFFRQVEQVRTRESSRVSGV